MGDVRQKILIVDDEPHNLMIMKAALAEEGNIRTVGSGEVAIRFARQFKPDVILLDILLPGMSGFETCTQLRTLPELSFTKLLLVSVKDAVEERLKGYRVGADDYIVKPFVPSELKAKVRVYLRLNRIERELEALNQSLEIEVERRARQLVENEAKLLQTARMSALGEMASSMAHEINTPMMVISRLVNQAQEILDQPLPDTELLKKMAKKIDTTCGRVSRIISGLRVFARDGSRDAFAPYPLSQLLSETMDLCADRFKSEGVALEVPSTLVEGEIECQSTQLCQVLVNLLNNAFDAVSESPSPWVRIEVEAGPNSLILKIMDSGKGVSLAVREKMFEPFFTTKGVGKGTGLGLSVSKGIIEAHGGSLSIDDRSPNTCFVIELPLRQPKTSTPQKLEAA